MGRPVRGPSGLGSPEALSVGRQMWGGGASASRGCCRIRCVEGQFLPGCRALPAHAERRSERGRPWADGGL